MTALEIVLTSLIGAIICLVIIIFIVAKIVTKFFINKVVDYKVLNEFAPEKPIVFLGDSLTDLFPCHEFLHDERIVNRGISNETTLDVEKRLNDVICLKPRAVFLLIGVNDFLRLSGKKEPSKVAERIVAIADKLKESCLDIRVISLYPINKNKKWFSKFYLSRVSNEKISTTNAIIKKLCLDKGYKYLDFNAYLIDEQGKLNQEYTVEGLHLNLIGYKHLTPYLKKELQDIE